MSDIEEKQVGTSRSASETTEARVSSDSAVEAQNAPEASEFNARSVTALVAATLGLFCTVGFVNAFGIFQTYYTQSYLKELSNFQISWIGSFSVFMLFITGPFAGVMSDKLGPTIPVAIGSVAQIVAVMMISLCKKYYQFFLAQGLLLGFGFGMITTPTSAIAPLYFSKNRGLAQGIIIGGSSIGGVIWPVMLDQLLYKDGVSFGWSLRIVGFFMIPLLATVVFGLKRPVNKPKPAAPAQEKDAAPGEDGQPQGKKPHKLAALAHPAYIFLAIGLAIFYFGFFSPFFFIPQYAIYLGQSQSFSFYTISILNAASLFGRVLPGFLADKIGHFNILAWSGLFSAVVCFCWTAVDNLAGLIFFNLAYGFVSGAVLSLQYACAGIIATKETVGAAFGILMASIALTVLFGTPISGVLLEDKGFLDMSMFSGATMLAGTVFLFASRIAWNRNIFAKA